jgi:hypothetical protein
MSHPPRSDRGPGTRRSTKWNETFHQSRTPMWRTMRHKVAQNVPQSGTKRSTKAEEVSHKGTKSVPQGDKVPEKWGLCPHQSRTPSGSGTSPAKPRRASLMRVCGGGVSWPGPAAKTRQASVLVPKPDDTPVPARRPRKTVQRPGASTPTPAAPPPPENSPASPPESGRGLLAHVERWSPGSNFGRTLRCG